MDYLETEDELQHFGIKGMKLGHRNKYDKSIPKIGQFSSKIKTNMSKRKNMKRSNEKKIASLKKSDPKRRELTNMNKDMTSMNSTAERRLARNRSIKRGIVKTTKFAAQRGLQKAIRRKVTSDLGKDFAARMFNEYKSPNSNIEKTMRRIRKSELGKKILKKVFGRSGGKGKAVGGVLKVAREAMKAGVPHVKS